ncbi:PTS sugar transporter subunit IIA [Pseudaquidulcibacter saccharophilus]|uniref:PTS sugar transporter subunit IIA n=1 Tax=Pseudaquidulcibacter saccharophilus TaxID=2831900 RepID=UPI001EFF521B|nr:PTS sugar transporter subunit IIA [Pseudaquidulcibacter saccharophilus]
MPKLGDLVNAHSVLYRAKGANRREVLKRLCTTAHDAYGVDADEAFENAMKREALGGTGVGEGVAVPHARIKGLAKSVGVFALLEKPTDFEGPDNIAADLVFLILSPEDSGASHLKALAKVTRIMREPKNRSSLRSARSAAALLALLTDEDESSQVA